MPPNTLTTLVSFGGTNGMYPRSALVKDADGNLYGTTGGEGSSGSTNFGTIFRLTQSGNFTTVVWFNGKNGKSPSGGLVRGNDGNLYGATLQGGSRGGGTIYRLGFAPVIQGITPSVTTNVVITWSSDSGRRYRVQYKSSLSVTNWTDIAPDVDAVGTSASKTDNPVG